MSYDYVEDLAKEAGYHTRIERSVKREYTEKEYRIYNSGSDYTECSMKTIYEAYTYTMKAERYY